MKSWTIVIAYGPDDDDTPQGFTRANAESLNSVRVGKLIFAFGFDQ